MSFLATDFNKQISNLFQKLFRTTAMKIDLMIEKNFCKFLALVEVELFRTVTKRRQTIGFLLPSKLEKKNALVFLMEEKYFKSAFNVLTLVSQ